MRQLVYPVSFSVLLAAMASFAPIASLAPIAAAAQTAPNPPSEQIIEPRVERRPIRVPRLPSNDWHIGGFVGNYASEFFGTNRVTGLRAGYHLTEDIFFEAAYGRTLVRDEAFRLTQPNGIFSRQKEPLTYSNLSAGFNVLPGEVFLSSNFARPSGLYAIAGLGSTRLIGERHHTVNVGIGLRVFVKDWAAIQVDMRDHLFALDILGRRQSTQNLELTFGATFFF